MPALFQDVDSMRCFMLQENMVLISELFRVL